MIIWDFPFDIYVFSMWVRCDHFDALQCIDCHQCSGTGRSRPLCKNCFVKTDLTDRIKVKEIFAHRMRAKEIGSCWSLAKSDCVIVGTDSILAWKLALKACWKTRVKISSRKILQKVTASSTLVVPTWYPFYAAILSYCKSVTKASFLTWKLDTLLLKKSSRNILQKATTSRPIVCCNPLAKPS